jgi:manganese/zinc/iron transport system permease protein
MLDSFWIMLTGGVIAVQCALLGCFLVLRRMALVGDAISHAVLPGIVLAYFLVGSRSNLLMLFGASVFGMLSTFLVEFFHQKAKVQSDASIGIVFTFLFALGVILISMYAGQIDLDQDCVLYGEIAYIPLDMVLLTDRLMLPRALLINLAVLVFILVFIYLFYKELFLTTFDPAYAAVMGIGVSVWHYALMGVVSLSTVAAFESVGAILVVALLIVPAATAYLLTKNFKKMLLIASSIGLLISIGGYWLAHFTEGSIAGGMASVAGILFAFAFILSPSEGYLWKLSKAAK